jgi:hypothetical protein
MGCREVDIEEEVEAAFWSDSTNVPYGNALPSVLCRKIDLGAGDVQRGSSTLA